MNLVNPYSNLVNVEVVSSRVMPKQTNAQKSTNARICDLCDGPFKATEQVLHCEGSCDKFFHRYCAGISKGYYQDLLTSSTPFVCNFHTTILFTMDCYVSFFPIYSTEDITSSKLL